MQEKNSPRKSRITRYKISHLIFLWLYFPNEYIVHCQRCISVKDNVVEIKLIN